MTTPHRHIQQAAQASKKFSNNLLVAKAGFARLHATVEGQHYVPCGETQGDYGTIECVLELGHQYEADALASRHIGYTKDGKKRTWSDYA